MPVRKFLKDQARKAIQWAMETEIPFTEPTRAKHIPKPITPETTSKTMSTNAYDLKGKTTLMLKSLLVIHESIEDAEAWQGSSHHSTAVVAALAVKSTEGSGP